MTPVRLPRSMRLIHWTTAALVLSLIGLGLAMTDSLANWRIAGIQLHKLAGLCVLVLTVLRLGLRAREPLPELPAHVSRLQQRVAGLVQVMIYLLLVAIPLSGWAMQGAAGNPVKVFGALTLPQISPESLVLYGALREAHGFLAISLLLLIMLHIAGALYHGLVLRDGVLRRML